MADIFQDGFEDQDISDWSDSGSSGDSSVLSSSAPDDGSFHMQVSQNAGSGTKWETYTDNTFDWNQTHWFKFLVHSDNFNSSSFLNTRIGWRGRRGDSDEVSIPFFDTDSNGNEQAFRFAGGGVSNTTTHSIDWTSGTWYWVKGKLDESNGTAEAKIWKDGNGEPSSMQISCDITTGITSEEVNVTVNGKDAVDLDIDVAQMQFADTEGELFNEKSTINTPVATASSSAPTPSLSADSTTLSVDTIASLQAVGLNPSVSPDTATISPPVATVQSSAPIPGISSTGTATISVDSIATAQATGLSPTLSADEAIISPPVASVETVAPTPIVFDPAVVWQIGDAVLRTVTDWTVRRSGLQISGVVEQHISEVRTLTDRTGEVTEVVASDGTYKHIATDGDNAIDVKPPEYLKDVIIDDKHFVRSYTDTPESPAGFTINVDIGTARESSRSVNHSTDESGTGWTLDFKGGGKIVVDKGLVSGDEKRAQTTTLGLTITSTQAVVLVETLQTTAAVNKQSVPDGSDFYADENANDRNTVTITSPGDIDFDDGDYVVSEWNVTSYVPNRHRARLTLAKI